MLILHFILHFLENGFLTLGHFNELQKFTDLKATPEWLKRLENTLCGILDCGTSRNGTRGESDDPLHTGDKAHN